MRRLAVAVAVALIPPVLAGCGQPAPSDVDNAAPANRRPSSLPAVPSSAAPTVSTPDGRTVTCPTGAEPAVTLTAAGFTPTLTDGRSMRAGRYRIVVQATVANDTTAPIAVHRITFTVAGVAWAPAVTAPATVGPGISVPLTVDGAYLSGGTKPADIRAALDWDWQDQALTACDERGLVEDD
jgi:hypothetical protein